MGWRPRKASCRREQRRGRQDHLLCFPSLTPGGWDCRSLGAAPSPGVLTAHSVLRQEVQRKNSSRSCSGETHGRWEQAGSAWHRGPGAEEPAGAPRGREELCQGETGAGVGCRARQAGPPHHAKEQRSRGAAGAPPSQPWLWQGWSGHSVLGRGQRGRLEWPLSTGEGGAESQGHLGNGASGLGASEHGQGRAAETATLSGG